MRYVVACNKSMEVTETREAERQGYRLTKTIPDDFAGCVRLVFDKPADDFPRELSS